jgi:hypothetical protein
MLSASPKGVSHDGENPSVGGRDDNRRRPPHRGRRLAPGRRR